MTLSSQEVIDLRSMIVQLCEGQIADEERSQLKSRLADSEESRWIFAEYNALFALLELEIPTLPCDECGMMNDDCTENSKGGQHSLDIQTLDSRHSPAPAFLPVPSYGTWSYLSEGWPTAYLLATVILGLGIVAAAVTYVSQPAHVASALPAVQTSRSVPEPSTPCVGRITGTVDCKRPGDSCVFLGQKCELASGLMEITYDTGAKVILQGPVTYEVDSNGGYLAVGKLTGKLEKKVASGQWSVVSESTINNQQSTISNSSLSTIHYPLFTIRTPTATVTDLGTEFGIEVKQDGSFRGPRIGGAGRTDRASRIESYAADCQ